MVSRLEDDKLNQQTSAVTESISALLDDQADDLDLRRVLKGIEADESVRSTWQRYHMMSSLIKKEPASAISIDISEQISAKIAEEAPLSLKQGDRSRWLNPIAKTGIAATVAVGFLLGVHQFSNVSEPLSSAELAENETFVAPDLNSAVVPVGFESPSLTARTVSTGQNQPLASGQRAAITALPESSPAIADAELQAHFDRLMMIHAQQVSDNSDLGVVSFARLTDLSTAKQPAPQDSSVKAAGDVKELDPEKAVPSAK